MCNLILGSVSLKAGSLFPWLHPAAPCMAQVRVGEHSAHQTSASGLHKSVAAPVIGIMCAIIPNSRLREVRMVGLSGEVLRSYTTAVCETRGILLEQAASHVMSGRFRDVAELSTDHCGEFSSLVIRTTRPPGHCHPGSRSWTPPTTMALPTRQALIR